MSVDNPNTPEHRLDKLEAKRDLFESIREADDLPPMFRQKYGQTPLEIIDDLRKEVGQ